MKKLMNFLEKELKEFYYLENYSKFCDIRKRYVTHVIVFLANKDYGIAYSNNGRMSYYFCPGMKFNDVVQKALMEL